MSLKEQLQMALEEIEKLKKSQSKAKVEKKSPKTEEVKFLLGKKELDETEMFDHLWKRCRNLESSEYYWFKQMSRINKWYGKELSTKQRLSMLPIWEKYRDSKLTPKPKAAK